MRPRAVFLLALVLLPTASAGAWERHGTDPDDVHGRLDVAGTHLRIWAESPGFKVVTLSIRTHEPFSFRASDGSCRALIDGRRGERFDHRISILVRNDRLAGVVVELRGPFRHIVRPHRVAPNRVTVRFPRDWLEPTEPLGWVVRCSAAGEVDRAPDAGRYGG